MCNKCNMNIKEYDDYFGTDKHKQQPEFVIDLVPTSARTRWIKTELNGYMDSISSVQYPSDCNDLVSRTAYFLSNFKLVEKDGSIFRIKKKNDFNKENSRAINRKEVYMNKKLYNTLCELTIDQLVELQVILNIETREKLTNLYEDLNKLVSLCNPHQEYHTILVNELYNFFSGEDLETMTDSGIPEKVEPKIDYMASIREACGR